MNSYKASSIYVSIKLTANRKYKESKRERGRVREVYKKDLQDNELVINMNDLNMGYL